MWCQIRLSPHPRPLLLKCFHPRALLYTFQKSMEKLRQNTRGALWKMKCLPKNEMPSSLLDEKLCFIRLPPDRVEQTMSDHLRYGLHTIFVRGPHCLWCPKNRWSPHLGTSIALKIDKNELEVRKLQPFKVGGGIVFYKK